MDTGGLLLLVIDDDVLAIVMEEDCCDVVGGASVVGFGIDVAIDADVDVVGVLVDDTTLSFVVLVVVL